MPAHMHVVYTVDNYIDYNSSYRECIIPDVSRTFHFASGTHVYPEQQRKYFETRSFNLQHQVQLKNLSQ